MPLALKSIGCSLPGRLRACPGAALCFCLSNPNRDMVKLGWAHFTLCRMKLIGARSLPGVVNLVGLQSPRLHLV